MSDTVSPRIDKLKKKLAAEELDAFVINAGPTLSYLTGLHFHLAERPVIIVFPVIGTPVIVLPELELAQLDKLPFEAVVYNYGENPGSWPGVVRTACKDINREGIRVGIEPRQLRMLEFDLVRQGLSEAVYEDFVDGTGVISALRAVKSEEEYINMKRAVEIAQTALEATLPIIKPGVNEKTIAAELFMQLMKNGSEPDLPFNPIVAGGPNGANPHATPGDRKLQEGDLLIIDWGASWNGYASDLTRTFAIGAPGCLDGESEKIHALVQAANQAGRDAGGPGVPCMVVDNAARKVIAEAGYGEFFTHRTGHGIGLECHESPYIHGDNKDLLLPGNSYTVEPGIYLPGKNGVRIEDDVIVTTDGVESLSTMTREIRYLY